jgi:CHAT domain-containing protein
VVDDAAPERSAILLAPGSPEEDGLLQIREIVELPLDGKIVVLSACGSAAGELLPGEGVLGLHRAFLQAGARAALGSLWPLRDEEAAALLTAFYRHLRRGQRLDEALAAAQRERIAAGAPPAAWAGMVLVGDGAVRPLRPRGGQLWWWATGGAAAALLLFTAALVSRRRYSSQASS